MSMSTLRRFNPHTFIRSIPQRRTSAAVKSGFSSSSDWGGAGGVLGGGGTGGLLYTEDERSGCGLAAPCVPC